jgi:hypothetical protein
MESFLYELGSPSRAAHAELLHALWLEKKSLFFVHEPVVKILFIYLFGSLIGSFNIRKYFSFSDCPTF